MRLLLKIAVIWIVSTEICVADCKTEMQRSDRILKCLVHNQSCDTVGCAYIGSCGEQFDQSGCLVALRYSADGFGVYYCDRENKWNISRDKQDVIAEICGTSTSAPPRRSPSQPAKIPSKTLSDAAKDGDVPAISRLIAQGANIDAPDMNEHTPLMTASMWGQVAAIDALLDAGANISARTKTFGLTALMLAAREGRVNAIGRLLQAGAKLEARSSANQGMFTALFLAASAGQAGAVVTLVSAGANVNTTDERQRTPFSRAAEHADVEVVQALLAAGADVNARDKNGYSPLDWVPIRGGDSRRNGRVRTLLVNAGAK